MRMLVARCAYLMLVVMWSVYWIMLHVQRVFCYVHGLFLVLCAYCVTNQVNSDDAVVILVLVLVTEVTNVQFLYSIHVCYVYYVQCVFCYTLRYEENFFPNSYVKIGVERLPYNRTQSNTLYKGISPKMEDYVGGSFYMKGCLILWCIR